MALTPAYPLTYDISDFSLGWDCINSPTTLDKRTFTDIKNFNLTRRRGLEKRGGISELYTSTAGADIDITSLYEYKAPDGNNYNLVATDTYIKSYFNATWNNLKTGLTAGKKYDFETHRGLCYGVNGLDDNFKLRNTTSYHVGIDPPLGAPTVTKGTAASASLYTNWGTPHIDYIGELRQNASRTMLAQAFIVDEDYQLDKVVLKCKEVGTITSGSMTVEIHSNQTGTIVGTASTGVDVTGFDSTLTATNFTFDGTKPSVSKNVTYYIIIKSTHTVSDTNFVEVGFDWNGSYTRGAYYEIDGSDNWTLFNDTDLGFEIWATQTTGTEQVSYGAAETGDNDPLRYVESNHLLAQSFTVSADSKVTSVKVPLERVLIEGGAVLRTFVLWAEIHSSRVDTSVVKNDSDNIVGEASDEVSTLTGVSYDSEWIEFTFSGTLPSLTADETYYLVLYCDYTENGNEKLVWALDDTGYDDGQNWWISYHSQVIVWNARGEDFSFKILGYPTAGASIESHSLSGITQIRGLRETNSQQMIVQSFTVDESANCTSVKVYMAKTGTPANGTPTVWAEIHSDQEGTSASKDSSLYQIGTASDTVATSTIGSFPTFGWVTFTFSGTAPNLNAGSTYYLVIYGDFAVSATNFVNIALDKVPAGYSGGTRWDVNTSEVWSEVVGQDIIFEVYLATGGLDATYYYCYTYKRTDWSEIEGNPSDVSDSVTPENQDVDVDVVASSDSQINKIVIYRTLQNETEPFYKLIELDNPTATITGTGIAFVDSTPDTITDTGNGFITAGFVANDKIIVSGAAQAANNITFTIASVVAGTITLISTDAVTTEGATANITISASGKVYSDSVSDNGLTTLYAINNTVPPKSKFIKLHQDRMFYANCPDEDEGESLVMWSKSGNGEAVPSVNYQYFDKDDGEEITGIASLGTFFFVFKPNKIGVLDVASPEIWYLGFGIGCIAPWAILTFKDKIVFLSEEGWKATDGTDIWDLSDNISGLIEDGYITIDEKEHYSVAYYPEKEHFEFLINHSTLTPKVIVGHFLVPLILKPTGISELVKQNIMGWTYHQYDYHTLTCIGNYTDSSGITRMIAGANNGFVYLLDSGTDDNGSNITTKLRTDWLSLGTPRSITKTIRKGYLTYGTSGTISLELTVDIDFEATDETSTFTGGDVDLNDSINEDFPLTGTGELFRFTLLETSSQSLDIMGLVIQFRSEGIR